MIIFFSKFSLLTFSSGQAWPEVVCELGLLSTPSSGFLLSSSSQCLAARFEAFHTHHPKLWTLQSKQSWSTRNYIYNHRTLFKLYGIMLKHKKKYIGTCTCTVSVHCKESVMNSYLFKFFMSDVHQSSGSQNLTKLIATNSIRYFYFLPKCMCMCTWCRILLDYGIMDIVDYFYLPVIHFPCHIYMYLASLVYTTSFIEKSASLNFSVM